MGFLRAGKHRFKIMTAAKSAGFLFIIYFLSGTLVLAKDISLGAVSDRILLEGIMGIGTTNPNSLLQLVGGSGQVLNVSGGQIGGLNLIPINADQAVPLGYLQTNYFSSLWRGTLNGTIYNGTAGTGNVGIGITTPSEKLEVAGNVKGVSFIYSSDYNLKKNIATITSPLQKILQLRGVTFNFKADNKPSVGLIAQEVKQVFPELVIGEEGNYGVQYGNLVAPLIEAVKAQQKEIENLNKRIKILEAKIN